MGTGLEMKISGDDIGVEMTTAGMGWVWGQQTWGEMGCVP